MFWWARYNGNNCLEPAPYPLAKSLLGDFTDPVYFPDFSRTTFKFYRDESVREEILDFAKFILPTFFIRERAFRALEEFITPNARSVEIICEGIPYRYFQVDRELDLFDNENSEINRWGLDPSIEPEAGAVERLVIKRPPRDCPDMFRLQGRIGARMCIVVSDNFKRVYEENSFTGLFFSPAERLLN